MTINGEKATFFRQPNGEWDYDHGRSKIVAALRRSPKDETTLTRIKALLWGLSTGILDPTRLKEANRVLSRAFKRTEKGSWDKSNVNAPDGLAFPIALMLRHIDMETPVGGDDAPGKSYYSADSTKYPAEAVAECLLDIIEEKAPLEGQAGDQFKFIEPSEFNRLSPQTEKTLVSCAQVVTALVGSDWGSPLAGQLVEGLLRLLDANAMDTSAVYTRRRAPGLGFHSLMEKIDVPLEMLLCLHRLATEPEGRFSRNPLARTALLLIVAYKLRSTEERRWRFDLLHRIGGAWQECREYMVEMDSKVDDPQRSDRVGPLMDLWAEEIRRLGQDLELADTLPPNISVTIDETPRWRWNRSEAIAAWALLEFCEPVPADETAEDGPIGPQELLAA